MGKNDKENRGVEVVAHEKNVARIDMRDRSGKNEDRKLYPVPVSCNVNFSQFFFCRNIERFIRLPPFKQVPSILYIEEMNSYGLLERNAENNVSLPYRFTPMGLK